MCKQDMEDISEFVKILDHGIYLVLLEELKSLRISTMLENC